jgi:2-isopropylmalate synthase
MRAEDVGWNQNSLVLGKHSGRNAFKARLTELGIDFDSDEELNDAFVRFKTLADKKHDIFDEDLQALVSDAQTESSETIHLVSLKVSAESGKENTADVILSINGNEQSASAKTSGAVDATFKAILSLVDIEPKLQLYSVTNVTQGTDSLGEVNVRLEYEGKIVNGQGVDTDIITSSAKAYVNALNKVMTNVERAHPQI